MADSRGRRTERLLRCQAVDVGISNYVSLWTSYATSVSLLNLRWWAVVTHQHTMKG